MKKFVLLVLACIVYYVYARTSFSEPQVTSWLTSHAMRTMSGDTRACDDYTDDVEVTLTADGRHGRWEVEGGKDEMCGYLRQAAAQFTVLQATTSTRFEDVRVERGRFPWTQAKVTYTQRTTVQASRIPTMTIESEDTVALVRTMSGTKIRSIESRATGGF